MTIINARAREIVSFVLGLSAGRPTPEQVAQAEAHVERILEAARKDPGRSDSAAQTGCQ